ncbi:hypothetical protein I545_1705 [Mycobacterium kansasii 662]|uniref:Transposase n=2 Tax=Mycobacterium kansasii TaxID=1768 RepID=A0A1V3XJG8_MYCKA|nr:hypothetical protein I545_1705 [Mycobacterium kansasii 662]OOK79282.1 hypothetical protein BZL30_2715 [Mycobacterium kansasii]
MAKRNYSEEFRRNAVELYRVTEGATKPSVTSCDRRPNISPGETNW